MTDSVVTTWTVPPDYSAHGISQARILEWVATSFFRGSSRPRDWTHVLCIGKQIAYCRATREDPILLYLLSHFSHVPLFVTLWTIAWQVPLSMGFSRQEYWSGLSCPSPGDLPNPGIEPEFSSAPAFQGDVLSLSHQGSPSSLYSSYQIQEI